MNVYDALTLTLPFVEPPKTRAAVTTTALEGVRLEPHGDGTVVLACDKYRLSVAYTDRLTVPYAMTLAPDSAKQLLAVLKNNQASYVSIGADGTDALAYIGAHKVWLTLIEATYPNLHPHMRKVAQVTEGPTTSAAVSELQFNPAFLAGLKALRSKRVDFIPTGPGKPVVVLCPDHPEWFGLFMPLVVTSERQAKVPAWLGDWVAE